MSVCVCAASHQRQQVEEQPGVLADEVVGLTTQVHKQLEATGGPLTSVDDVRHVRGQDEWSAVPGGRRGRGQGSHPLETSGAPSPQQRYHPNSGETPGGDLYVWPGPPH